MPFPTHGFCPTEKSHIMVLKREAFLNTYAEVISSCDECGVDFKKVIGYRNNIMNPHCYYCKQCRTYVCFNCAQSANLPNKEWIRDWRIPTQFQWLQKQYIATLNLGPSSKCAINEQGINRFKVNGLLNDMDDHNIQRCTKNIIKLLGGHRSMLQFIVKYATQEQLDIIYKQGMQQLAKHSTQSNTHKSLGSMSKECMSHVIGYLNFQDIHQFKVASRRIFVSCWEEKSKYPIRIVHGNTMLNNANMNPYDLKSCINTTRYNGRKTFGSVCRTWCDKYNVLPNNLLVIGLTEYLRDDLNDNHFVNTKEINAEPLEDLAPLVPYLFMDKTKAVILDDNINKIRVFDQTQSIAYEKMANYKLMVLRYFDIMNQTIRTVQYIFHPIKKNVHDWFHYTWNTLLSLETQFALCDYIENKFIAFDDVDNTWHDELILILKQMNADDIHPKLSLHYTSKQGICTIQVNPYHPWFCMDPTKRINDIRAKCKTNGVTFHSRADDFYKTIRTVMVCMQVDKHILKSCIQTHYEARLNKDEKKLFHHNMETIYDAIARSQFSFRVASSPVQNELTLKICKLYDNLIHPESIILVKHYALRYNCYLLWGQPSNSNDHAKQFYHVNIYTPMHGPHPFYSKQTPCKSVTITYQGKCNSHDFIEHVFDTLYTSKDHILYDGYKDLMDLYYGNRQLPENEDDCDMLEPELPHHTSNGIKCIVHKSTQFIHHKDNKLRVDLDDIESEFESMVHLDLFMIRMKTNDQSRNIKLKIEFRTDRERLRINKGERVRLYTSDRVGLPLFVWINKGDTLMYVIDKYLANSKGYIESCRRVRTQDEDTRQLGIPRKQWPRYQIYFQMDLPDESLLFRFHKIRHQKISIPQLDTTVYEQFDKF
eukprot:364040_1